MDDRRVSSRLAINRLAELRVEGNLRPIPCTVEDISASGMRVSLRKNLFPEVFSKAHFSLADNFDFDVGAGVAWQDKEEGKSTYGLRFNRIDEFDRARISQYVDSSLFEEKRNNWWKGL